MKSLLTLVVAIVSLAGCTVASDAPRPVAEATQTNAKPAVLRSTSGHEAMMKLIHRRPKNGTFGAIGG